MRNTLCRMRLENGANQSGATGAFIWSALGRVSSRPMRGSIYRLVLPAAWAMLCAAAAHAQIHGVQIGKSCESPRCVGQTTDCLIQLTHADGFGDTIRITEAFDRIDPDGANIRVPAAGNLPIVTVSGNTTCTIAGSLPCLIGPGGSTLSGLPGTAGTGTVTFQTDTYVIQPGDPSPLEDEAFVRVQDLCDDPGTAGCFGGISTIQFTAATMIPSPCCGDNFADSPETCDGPDEPLDCNQACRPAGDADECTCCGDGIMQGGEDCDDGNAVNNDACTNSCTVFVPTTIFVDASATGANNGTSWVDAYVHLQDALSDAQGNPNITEIWVADGTYMPDGGYTPIGGGHVAGSGDRAATFQLLDDVAIYGGFAGGETNLSERDIEANETILSGDLTGNDTPVACTQNSPDCDSFGGLCVNAACIIRSNNTENSYHVVTGMGTGPTAVLDGFTITAGRADGAFPDDKGAGMFNDNCSPSVARCVFRGNLAVEYGGGVDDAAGGGTFSECTFQNNTAGIDGGGMSTGASAVKVVDCIFVANSAGQFGGGLNLSLPVSGAEVRRCDFRANFADVGGGLRVADGSGLVVVSSNFLGNLAVDGGGMQLFAHTGGSITNCGFIGNAALDSGGGLGIRDSSVSIQVVNCAFSGNSASLNGGGIYNDASDSTVTNSTFSNNDAAINGGGIYNLNNSSPVVTNCVLWGNLDSGGTNESAQIHTASGTPSVNDSIVQGGWSGAGSNNLNADPLLIDPDGIDGIIGTLDDDVRLQPGSPAIDAGDNAALPPDVADLDGDMNTAEQIPFDLTGNPRRVDDPFTSDTGNGAPPVVDMGAHEFEANVLFVNDDAAGAKDGSSWTNAYTYLQDALTYAAGNPQITEIWVAAGTYKPHQKSCSTVADCGGPPNVCAPVGQCIWDQMRTQTFQLLNGVAIYGGFAGTGTLLSQRDVDANPTILSGDLSGNDAALACAQDSPDCDDHGGLCVDASCIVRANNSENSIHVVTGSGTDASASLDGFTISDGYSDGGVGDLGGGGMFNDAGHPTIRRCTFARNISWNVAGGMLNDGASSPVVEDCLFVGNSASASGGGMHNNTGSIAIVRDVTFLRNYAHWGGALVNYESSAQVINCTFVRNRGGLGAGGVENAFGNPTLVNCGFWGNHSAFQGGGMRNGISDATVVNCVFSGNTSDSVGGAISNLDSSPAVINCSLANNSALDSGGGMYNGEPGASSPSIANSVFWNNSDAGGMDESAQIHTASGTPVVSYSVVQGGWSGVGSNNLNADPLFFDIDGVDGVVGTFDDDLRLRAGSPAIDAGDSTALPLDTLDLDSDLNTTEYIPFDLAGNPRQFDDPDTVDTGVPGSPVVDIGAYEFFTDCNGNGIVDGNDIAGPGSDDCSSSGWASNGIPDECDISACDGDVGCEDCNLNGVPDGCDIGAATSVDTTPMDGIPDECVFFTAACNPPTDEWSCFNNWDIPDDVYPDNVGGDTYSVVLTGAADDVCLDVSVTIDTLKIEKNATLRVTQPDPDCDGALGRQAGAAAGPALTMEIIAPGGLEVEATLAVAGTNVIDVTSGPMVVGNDGTYTVDPGATLPVGTSLHAFELRILGGDCYIEPCPDGGRVELTDTMSLTVTGDLTIDGRLANGECDFDHFARQSHEGATTGSEAMRSFHTPPVKITRNQSIVYIYGGLHLIGAAGSINESSIPVTLGGDFDNQSTRPDCFDWTLGKLVLDGNEQNFEVASPDVGEPGPRGTVMPFYIDSLTVAAGGSVTLRDNFDNDSGGQGSCTEALYVGTLTLEAGATLILQNCRFYADTVIKDPSAQIVPQGCAAAAPPELLSDPIGVSMTRFLSMVVPASETGDSALRVRLTSLHHPTSPPVGTPDFTALEGQYRYVNSFGGATLCVDSATFSTNYRCGQLGCQPEYRDWATELSAPTNPASTAGLIHVSGDSIVPSSTLTVSQIAASCGAAPAANSCALASAALTISTSRWGDVAGSGGGPPDGIQNVIDIGSVVDNVKGIPTAIPERRAWMKNPPNIFGNPVNVIDIGLTVDSVKGFPYPYMIAACP